MDGLTARRHLSEDSGRPEWEAVDSLPSMVNHPIDQRKQNSKVLSYLMLADFTFGFANNSSSLKIAKVVCSLGSRHR